MKPFKVTIKFVICCMLLVINGCNGHDEPAVNYDTLRARDAASEARIDSMYAVIKQHCDSLQRFVVPALADSLQAQDSLALTAITDTGYTDTDEKAAKVIRQLKVDCNASLLAETYKRWRHLKAQGARRHRR